MPFIFKRLALFLSITAGFAADKEAGTFRAAPASSYEHHQTNDAVTVGVEPYQTPEKEKTVFGKLDLYQYGVLPVLVVIQNDAGPNWTATAKNQKESAQCMGGGGPGLRSQNAAGRPSGQRFLLFPDRLAAGFEDLS